MLFRKTDKRLRQSIKNDTRIQLGTGGFYDHEVSENPMYSLYCLRPLDESGDMMFPALALECAAQLLSGFPRVVNRLSCVIDSYQLKEEPFVLTYQSLGGNPIFLDSRTLQTTTEGIDRKLLNCIPEKESQCYELTFYGFETMLMDNFYSKAYQMELFYHEDHDYLLLEMLAMTDEVVEKIRKICKNHGRDLEMYGFGKGV
ncbi:hypothetical protein KQI82_12980 [Oscillibacter sp. MSJ-2]|uniref:Uncharacterized protein n=1 Tax=Dysosmobacter acutus TaxID=2841504 RepID=A0ABS6FC15_9FIRM|nr:hypothetical protein [Dysosmobacter acutus]MBU5627825.1 hypothetical protein [Dysosmobacter acutus]